LRKIRCPRCRQMYKFSGAIAHVSFCPECLINDKELACLVKDYVSKNRNCSASEVAIEFNIPLARVRSFLKADFIGIKGENHGFLLCEECEKPINWGKHCHPCHHKFELAVKAQQVKK